MSIGSSPASERTTSRAEARAAVAEHASDQLHDQVAALVAHAGVVLDLGCGDGPLQAALGPRAGGRWVGVDVAPAPGAPSPWMRADVSALPVRTGSVDAVVALWVLHEIDDVDAALAEVARVLAPGGRLLAATSARDDSPELVEHFELPPTAFDAEDAPALVGEHLGEVVVHAWDEVQVRLPDVAAVGRYLRGRGASPASAAAAADDLGAPLGITRRGALVIGTR